MKSKKLNTKTWYSFWTKLEAATLEEIECECIRIMGTPFGHNMIGIICNVVEEKFGEQEANRLFDLYQK